MTLTSGGTPLISLISQQKLSQVLRTWERQLCESSIINTSKRKILSPKFHREVCQIMPTLNLVNKL